MHFCVSSCSTDISLRPRQHACTICSAVRSCWLIFSSYACVNRVIKRVAPDVLFRSTSQHPRASSCCRGSAVRVGRSCFRGEAPRSSSTAQHDPYLLVVGSSVRSARCAVPPPRFEVRSQKWRGLNCWHANGLNLGVTANELFN